MLTGKIFIDTRRKSKKGYPLKIRLQYQRALKEISLYKYTEFKDINKIERQLKFFINKRNLELIKQIDYCNDNRLTFKQSIDIVKSGKIGDETDIAILREKLKQLQTQAQVGLLEFFEVRINEKTELNEATSAYKDIFKLLYNYLGGIDINMNAITYEWLNRFIIHKRNNGCGVAGINAYLASIRAVYKEAQRRKSLNVKTDNPFQGLFKPAIKKHRNIPNHKIYALLLNYKTSKYQSVKSRILTNNRILLSFFQYLIGGHYLVDVALLKWSDYKNGRLTFKRYKNRNKPDGGVLVDVRVFKPAKEIIELIGTKNKERIFDFIPSPETNELLYKTYQGNTNRTLKTMFKNMELDFDYTSRTPRYIFRTRAGNLMINDFVIMQIQGHKPKGITFSYQGRVPNKLQDKVHKKIIKKYLKTEQISILNIKTKLHDKSKNYTN